MPSNTIKLLTMFPSEPPPSWHLLRKTPDEWNYTTLVEDQYPTPLKKARRNEPAEVGEIFSLTVLRVEALVAWARKLCIDAGPRAAKLDWVKTDLFNPPSMDAVVTLFKVILAPNLYPSLYPLFGDSALAAMHVNRATMLALCFWTLRQRNLIDGDIWGAVFRCVYIVHKVSLQTSVALTDAELGSMFHAAGDDGLFNTNETINSRDDLPETIRLHRGIASDMAPSGFLGHSWTDDRDTASAFAIRRSHQGMGGAKIVSATFERNEIATVFEHPGAFNEWLIQPDAEPKAIELHSLRFDLFSSRYAVSRIPFSYEPHLTIQ